MLRYAYVSSGLAQHRLEDALELLRDAGYAGVALTLDHVHAKDMRRRGADQLMLGDGDLDLPAALRALAEGGYEGLVAVELPRHAHLAPDVVPRAIARLRDAERDRRCSRSRSGSS